MKLIWVFLIIISITNVTRAKNLLDIFLGYRAINNNVSKVSKPLLFTTKKGSFGLFPRLSNKENRFVVTLKPPIEAAATESEQYKTPIIPKLLKKIVNNQNNDEENAEVTTRRTLIKMKKFTVRPHDVYPESVRELNNWNNFRKNINNNSRLPKSEQNLDKSNSKTINKGARFRNDLKNTNMARSNNNYSELEKVDNQKSNVAIDSRLKITLLFPKRNNTKYFTGISKQKVSKRPQINNFIADSKPFYVVNNESNAITIKENENITVYSNELPKSDSIDQIEKDLKINDQEIKMQDDFISVQDGNEIAVELDGDGEMTTDGDIEYLRQERSVNIIVEENIATTLSGIKITNQDYPIQHDWTFKNIHT